jgi:hypothetical protein
MAEGSSLSLVDFQIEVRLVDKYVHILNVGGRSWFEKLRSCM